VMKAYGNPAQLEDALGKSYQMQADLVALVVLAHDWNSQLKDLVSGSIKNDLLVSDALSKAAFEGAYHTAMINVVYMKDADKKQRAEKAMQELKARFEKGAAHAR
jgi:formiminotetrahydrofolate cyclodeaminase